MATVAIVGRPNVGKSALFNRLAGRRIAIVHDQPGVTRDRISAPCSLTEHPCTLIDTGGIGATLEDGFGDQVEIEADIAMETADLILFIVDAQDGLTSIDEALAHKLHKAKPPILMVLNKVDHEKHEAAFSDFTRLGFKESVSVSAEHGRNFSALIQKMDAVLEPLASETEKTMEIAETVGIKLAVVGRPNAGKSSLINAILQDERTIVSDIAGTTRDALDLPYTFAGENFTLIDTAGLRPRSRRDNSVEIFSAMRTEKAIRRADLCVLVIDLAAGITSQDRKIAQLILKEKKPCLIVLNKFDLYHPGADLKDRIAVAEDHVRRELFFLSYAPFVVCSALTGDSTDKVLKTALSIKKTAQNIPGTGQLNRILQDAMQRNSPPSDSKARRIKLYYAATALDEKYSIIPVPTLVLFVNDKHLMKESYQTYLANQYREAHPAPGIPVIFSVRSRTRREWTPQKNTKK